MKRLTRKTAFQLESLESRRLLSALTVSNAADSGVGSLRAQIAAAQSGDSINFTPSLAGQTITLTSGEIAFAKSLTIQGLGANQLTISGNGQGGIFYITGTNQVAIRDLTITGGASTSTYPVGGGAIYNNGTLTISGCTLSGNITYAYDGDGGAIFNSGTLTVSASTFFSNNAGRGGAIFNSGTLTVSGSNLSDNNSNTGGGGAIFNSGTLTVSGSNLSENFGSPDAIFNSGTLMVSGSNLSNNPAGAIFSSGPATISDCNLSGNGEWGGAITANGGALTVSNCTIANNRVVAGSSYFYDDEGNLIRVVGAGAAGAGILIQGGGTLSIDHSTVAGNYAAGGYGDPGYEGFGYGAGIFSDSFTPIQLYDTIIANNYADFGPDVYINSGGPLSSLGHNLIGNASGLAGFVASDLLNVDPQLVPLQKNGGPTETMALLPGSPAINAGDNTNAPVYDQRGAGFPRIVGGTIDIGAFETDDSPDYTGLRINDVTATEGNTGTVNATMTVSLAAPVTRTVTVNFATSDGSATVAGGDYLATSGTLTFSPGQTSKTILIPVKGDRIAEADKLFYVNLTGATNAYLFDSQGVVTIVDDEPRVSISDASVPEGNIGATSITFSVTLAAAYDVTTTVDFATSDGSATIAGGDYLATSGTITFSPGQTSETISIPVNGDRIAEADEQFYVNLSDASNRSVIDCQGVMTIVDDEPRVSIGNASVTEGNSGTTPMNFTVTLSAPYDVATTVNFNTAGGSAISGKDFDPASGTLTFLPLQTSKTLAVAVRGDVVDEYDETFTVALSGATSAMIVNGQGTGTILDNDAPPAIVVSDVTRAEGNAGTTPFTFTISLLTPSEKYVSVGYATANGTATSSTVGNKQDYLPASNTVTISPGQQSATVTTAVVGDTRSESDETFFLNLSNPANATLGDAQGIGTILNDEGGRGKNWVGPTSGGSWGTAANWSPSGVPVSDTLVLISGAAVTLSANASVSELSLGDGASLTVAAAGNRVLRMAGLYFGQNSKLNLNDNALILDYTGATPIGDVMAQVTAGRAASPAPAGIYSAPANASGNVHALGVAEASQVPGAVGSVIAGATVDATTVFVKFTYGGDANLDGKLNIDDYVAIDQGISAGLTGWSNGDFNYDGKVNIDDYTTVIDANIGNQNGFVFPTGSGAGESVSVVPVPEPTLTGLTLGGTALLIRRRRPAGHCDNDRLSKGPPGVSEGG